MAPRGSRCGALAIGGDIFATVACTATHGPPFKRSSDDEPRPANKEVSVPYSAPREPAPPQVIRIPLIRRKVVGDHIDRR